MSFYLDLSQLPWTTSVKTVLEMVQLCMWDQTIKQPNVCSTLVPLLQEFQNGVCHYSCLKIYQVMHETGVRVNQRIRFRNIPLSPPRQASMVRASRRKAEIRRRWAENVYVDLPWPMKQWLCSILLQLQVFLVGGILNKDPTVCLTGASPSTPLYCPPMRKSHLHTKRHANLKLL
jgi:hypothetical protein